MKKVEIKWNQSELAKRGQSIPNSNVLYTQIYTSKEEAWSVVLTFDITPQDQGQVTQGKARMLNEESAPQLLTPGFVFDFLDGPHKIGECRVIEGDK